MSGRFVSIWFRHLATDWFSVRQPRLRQVPFVLRSPSRGRMMVTAANAAAQAKGIGSGMVLADARAVMPDLEVMDDQPGLWEKVLTRMAEWGIRFTPVVAVDPPDGLLLEATGCPHLWGGDENYLDAIVKKLNERGYDVRAAMADTPGVAWGVARFGSGDRVVPPGRHREALASLPPDALRLEDEAAGRLHKLGLHRISQFIRIPRPSLRRRFGAHFIMRLDMALGNIEERITPVQPPEPYQERLPCMEPVTTATGIAMALRQLLETLCLRLQQEQKGLRSAQLRCYRVDGRVELAGIGTSSPSHSAGHLFRLFEMRLASIAPGLGIELFVLEAPKTEDHQPRQGKMWEGAGALEDMRLSELVDRLANRIGAHSINRYVPEERYWPERSFRRASSLREKITSSWRADKPRPLQILKEPERIEVTAPIPDYPPMLFIHRGKLHKITRADGPERIEQEWWVQQGQHRDYYSVEDEEGNRYWLFRLGHYHDQKYQWFIHGFFA